MTMETPIYQLTLTSWWRIEICRKKETQPQNGHLYQMITNSRGSWCTPFFGQTEWVLEIENQTCIPWKCNYSERLKPLWPVLILKHVKMCRFSWQNPHTKTPIIVLSPNYHNSTKTWLNQYLWMWLNPNEYIFDYTWSSAKTWVFHLPQWIWSSPPTSAPPWKRPRSAPSVSRWDADLGFHGFHGFHGRPPEIKNGKFFWETSKNGKYHRGLKKSSLVTSGKVPQGEIPEPAIEVLLGKVMFHWYVWLSEAKNNAGCVRILFRNST